MLVVIAEMSELADEQDSDSCVGYHVWVQIPFSALLLKKNGIKLENVLTLLQFDDTIYKRCW